MPDNDPPHVTLDDETFYKQLVNEDASQILQWQSEDGRPVGAQMSRALDRIIELEARVEEVSDPKYWASRDEL